MQIAMNTKCLNKNALIKYIEFPTLPLNSQYYHYYQMKIYLGVVLKPPLGRLKIGPHVFPQV